MTDKPDQNDRKLLEQALEALEYIHEGANNQGPHTGISWRCVSVKAEPVITAIRARLEQPEQSNIKQVIHLYDEPSAAPVQDSTCNETLRTQGKAYPRTCKKCGLGPCVGKPTSDTTPPAYDQGWKDGYKHGAWANTTATVQKPCNHNESVPATVCKRCLCIVPTPAAQPAPVQEPVAWAGWHTSTDEMMLFKTKAEAVSWRDQYKKDFASIEGLVRPFLPAAPVQEPVTCNGMPAYEGPLSAAQRQWVGLDGDEIRRMWNEASIPERSTMAFVVSFARAIEAKLKEKNAL